MFEIFALWMQIFDGAQSSLMTQALPITRTYFLRASKTFANNIRNNLLNITALPYLL
jgi:hypothetical protein